MEEFYYDLITAISELDPFVKILIGGMLLMLVVFSVMKIVKTHVNPKKAIFKFGQFLLLAILVGATVFFAVHAF